tara:strand:- start:400 stop:876 length:477 start_codon:yes stop_codon:yes gene_type:complete
LRGRSDVFDAAALDDEEKGFRDLRGAGFSCDGMSCGIHRARGSRPKSFAFMVGCRVPRTVLRDLSIRAQDYVTDPDDGVMEGRMHRCFMYAQAVEPPAAREAALRLIRDKLRLGWPWNGMCGGWASLVSGGVVRRNWVRYLLDGESLTLRTVSVDEDA